MKLAAVCLLSIGLSFAAFATDVPSVNDLTESLSRGPWAELPVRAVAAVRHAKASRRKDTTIAVVKASLGLNPAAATAIVASIARAEPAMAAVAAGTAAALQPKQAPEIALAAAAVVHSAAAAIVVAVCQALPAQYDSVAVAVSTAVPGSTKDILQAVGIAEADLKAPIDQVVAQYNGFPPSVALVLAQAKPMTHVGTSEDLLANDRSANTHVHRITKYPVPDGGFGGQPPPKYSAP
jgi:hypothetical protein